MKGGRETEQTLQSLPPDAKNFPFGEKWTQSAWCFRMPFTIGTFSGMNFICFCFSRFAKFCFWFCVLGKLFLLYFFFDDGDLNFSLFFFTGELQRKQKRVRKGEGMKTKQILFFGFSRWWMLFGFSCWVRVCVAPCRNIISSKFNNFFWEGGGEFSMGGQKKKLVTKKKTQTRLLSSPFPVPCPELPLLEERERGKELIPTLNPRKIKNIK